MVTGSTHQRAVLFDMDGVLVLSEEAHFSSWRDVAAAHGVDLTHEVFLSTFGHVNADCIPTMFGADVSPEDIERIADEKERAYRDLVRADLPLAPGIFPLLDGLREGGALLAVGTSAPRENLDLILDAGGLREYFSASVHGGEVANGKPAPDVFLLAAERLAVPPARCTVVEDAPAGILAARAAGMRAVGVATTHPAEILRSAGAHVVASELRAVDPAAVVAD